MKRFILIAAALAAISLLLSRCDADQLLNPGFYARFGNWGGGQRSADGREPFDSKAIKFGIRWLPAHVSFGPDNDSLLVSLCHVGRPILCRIGMYKISADHWDIMPFEQNRTYLWPIFSPDGRWIVFSTQPCDAQASCDQREMQLVKMSIDGTKTEIVADAAAVFPSFSANGKKLIYWRQNVVLRPDGSKFAGGMNLYQLEWATGKESALTDLTIMPGSQIGKPFFTADGERFLFMVRSDVLQLIGAPERMFRSNAYWMGSMKDVPITKNNYQTLEVVSWEQRVGEPVAMDGQGRFLYGQNLGEKKRAGEAVALAIRPANPSYKPPRPATYDEARAEDRRLDSMTDEQFRRGELTRFLFNRQVAGESYQKGGGWAYFLRKPVPPDQDEVAFDMDAGTASMSVSPNSQHLALVLGNPALPENDHGIGVISLGQKMSETRFLTWPQIDLVPTLPRKP